MFQFKNCEKDLILNSINILTQTIGCLDVRQANRRGLQSKRNYNHPQLNYPNRKIAKTWMALETPPYLIANVMKKRNTFFGTLP